MDKARLILEQPCEHDVMHRHAVRDEHLMWLDEECSGGSRTVLDPDLVVYEGYNVSPVLTVRIVLDTLDALLPKEEG